MTDNRELAVIADKVEYRANGTYYPLNTPTRAHVKHTLKDTWVCLTSTCLACDDPRDPARHKGCEHTRCAKAYAEAHPEPTTTENDVP